MPTRWSDRRTRFREIIAGDRCVYPGSVFDPISTRIAADLGFEVAMFAGSVASMAILGAPDNITITLTEFAEQAHRICRAAEIPLMVDADHGYGNALNVMRTVEELETAGIAGLSIEDTLLPEPFGGGTAAPLLSIAEGAGKMRAAVAARHDPSLVIAARTSAFAFAGRDEAIARIKAYSATGVDAIFLVGLKTPADLETMSRATSLPLILGSIPAELADRDLLSANRVRIALQGHQSFQASVQATYATLKALRDGTAPAQLQGLASAELMSKVTRADDYAARAKAFLGS
jgi:oxaloacetate decarboxylase